MDQRVVGWCIEAVRFASVVAVYWGIQTLVPYQTDWVTGKIIEALLEAFVAGLVVAIFLDLGFGHPTVSIRWAFGSDPPMSGRYILAANKTRYNVQLHTSGSSFIHRIGMWRSQMWDCHIHVDLSPDSSVTVQVQSVGANTHARNAPNGAGFIIENVSLRNGINSTVDVSIKRRGTSPAGNDLEVSTAVCWGSCSYNWPRLVKIDVGVEGFHLRGRA